MQIVGLNIEDVDNESDTVTESAVLRQNQNLHVSSGGTKTTKQQKPGLSTKQRSSNKIAAEHKGAKASRLHSVVSDESILPVGYAQEI